MKMAIFRAIKAKRGRAMLSKTSSSKPGHIHVAFALPDSLWAERVFLVGDFNDWNPTSIPLQRDRSEIWQAELDLPVGVRYAFRYWVDGRWLIDPHADGFTPDACSSLVDTTDWAKAYGTPDEGSMVREGNMPVVPFYIKRR
jgi:1,4-alpha-glucan branching enzyme